MFRISASGLRSRAQKQLPSLHHQHESYRWWVLGNIMIGTFMAVLDATIVNVGLPKIMASFGVTVDKVEWVVTAYMLVMAVMLPTSGWLADHLGFKRTYFGALFVFTLGSFLCGLSWDENALIVFRIIQGAGAGFLMPVGMAIVMREFPPEKRGVALGFWTIAAAASVSLGPLAGGYLVDHFSWQSIFDINVPIGIIGMFVTAVIQREYRTEKVRSFDVAGFLSVTVFLTFLLLALTDGNAAWNTGGWTSDFILSCFVLSFVGLVVFLWVELTTEHPLIELRLLKNFTFGMTNIVLFIFGIGMFGSTFLLPLYLQNSLGYTALQAGAVFLPVGILQALTSPISGYLADKGNPKIPIFIGVVLLAISLYMNYFLSLFSERDQIMLSLYIRGIAMGLLFTPLSAIALSDISREKMAQASGLFNVIRQVGGSFGVAILGTMLTRRVIFHSAMYSQSVDQSSPSFQHALQNLQLFAQHAVSGTATESMMRAKALVGMHVAQQAFVSAIGDDFLLAGVITIFCAVPIIFLHTKKRRRDQNAVAIE